MYEALVLSCLTLSLTFTIESNRLGRWLGRSRSVPLPSNNTCTSLCAEGYFIVHSSYDINVTISDLEEVSCGYLAYLERSALILDDDCPVFMAAAQRVCCNQSDTTLSDSPNLGETTFSIIPDDNDASKAISSTRNILFVVSVFAATTLLVSSI